MDSQENYFESIGQQNIIIIILSFESIHLKINISKKIVLLCQHKLHMKATTSFRVQRSISSSPLMTKPSWKLSPLPWKVRFQPAPDWWPTHLNSQHQKLPHCSIFLSNTEGNALIYLTLFRMGGGRDKKTPYQFSL